MTFIHSGKMSVTFQHVDDWFDAPKHNSTGTQALEHTLDIHVIERDIRMYCASRAHNLEACSRLAKQSLVRWTVVLLIIFAFFPCLKSLNHAEQLAQTKIRKCVALSQIGLTIRCAQYPHRLVAVALFCIQGGAGMRIHAPSLLWLPRNNCCRYFIPRSPLPHDFCWQTQSVMDDEDDDDDDDDDNKNNNDT